MSSAALGYLTRATFRNRAIGAARRLRSPRYALAMAIGAAYIWFSLLRRSTGAGEIAHALLGARSELLITLAVLVFVAFGWFSGGDRRTLAFSQAEVFLLFPAPLSRRALVVYKISRSQILIAFNALIWVFVLRRGGGEGLPALLRYLAVWIVLSNLALHRLGAALVRVSWREHGRTGARRQWIALALFAAIIAVLLVIVVRVWPALRASGGLGEMIDELQRAFSSPAALAVLFPIRIALAPAFAHSPAGWAGAMWPALVLAALQLWWVLRTDAAFEEAAVEASLQRARRIEMLRSRGVARVIEPKRIRRTLPLAPTGFPLVAIVWKNVLCLVRAGQLASLAALVVSAGALSVAVTSAGSGSFAENVMVFSTLMIALLFLLGTRLVRSDLREDLLHLDALKTLPLSGRSIVAAEITSSAVPIAAAQLVLLVASFVSYWFTKRPPLSPRWALAVFLGGPATLIALDAATLTIQNGTALLFPSWVRLGVQQPGGVEILGQGILTTVGSLVLLAIALVPPVLLALILFFATGGGAIALASSAWLGAALLLVEVWLGVGRLGRVFEKSEPAALT